MATLSEELIDFDYSEERMRALGPVLAKACGDPFSYVLGLSDGRQISFESAEWMEGSPFILLRELYDHDITDGLTKVRGYDGMKKYSFGRGVQVRIDQIVWVSDAGGYDS